MTICARNNIWYKIRKIYTTKFLSLAQQQIPTPSFTMNDSEYDSETQALSDDETQSQTQVLSSYDEIQTQPQSPKSPKRCNKMLDDIIVEVDNGDRLGRKRRIEDNSERGEKIKRPKKKVVSPIKVADRTQKRFTPQDDLIITVNLLGLSNSLRPHVIARLANNMDTSIEVMGMHARNLSL